VKYLLLSLLGLVVGFAIGGVALYTIPRLNLPRTHRLYQLLGIQKPQVFGFLPYWLVGKADPQSLNSLTTLAYFGLQVSSDGTIVRQLNAQEEEPGWTKLKSEAVQKWLKDADQKNIQLSLVVAGGGEENIAQLIADPEVHARALVKEVAPIMRQYHFTDLNLDLESFRSATESAQTHFSVFAKTLKNELATQQLGTLSVDVSPSIFIKDLMISPVEVGQIADTVIIMMYDFATRGSFIAGPPAPLEGHGQVREFDMTLALNQALTTVPKQKIVLALPLYGYEWESLSKEPGGAVIPQTGSTATLQRVSELLTNCPNCIQGRDEVAQEAYLLFSDKVATASTHHIFYDDNLSVQRKIEWLKERKLGGVGFWALGYEDAQTFQKTGAIHQYKKSFYWLTTN
jgi:spore germination protein YaaH